MNEFSIDKLKNIGLLGHGGTGKTSLNEAILFCAKATTRMGVIDDGSTVSDYTEDEVNRKISIGLALSHLEWKGSKINLIDMPGFADFCTEVYAGLSAADFALIVVNGVSGSEVGTSTAWRAASEGNLPRGFFINRMDKEHADSGKVLEQIQSEFGDRAVPVTMAIGGGPDYKGVIDILSSKAYTFDKSGKATETDLPADLKGEAESYREKIVEAAAEADDALLEKFFEAGELTPEELQKGLAKGIADGKIFPVFAGAAPENSGMSLFLDFAVEYFPSPDYLEEKIGFKPGTDEIIRRKISSDGPVSLYAFKTISEPHVGELSFFKVYSGIVTPGADMHNVNSDSGERFGQIYLMNGKERKEIDAISAGDIGAVVKLKTTHTGHTLSDKKELIQYEPAKVPSPIIRMAIEAKTKGDEDKIGSGLARLREEDPSIKVEVVSEIKQTILSGQGELHLDVIIDRLKRKFGVEVELDKPRIPYRESIKSKVEIQGKYKKQS
ncbi:MAG: GTP-binding protein, partial [candidate division Zixibacteria bacterium]